MNKLQKKKDSQIIDCNMTWCVRTLEHCPNKDFCSKFIEFPLKHDQSAMYMWSSHCEQTVKDLLLHSAAIVIREYIVM